MNLNQVTVAATDLCRSVKFYQALGLELIVDSVPRYVRFECPDGGATLSLHRVDKFQANDTTIYFECEDLDERVAVLESQGLVFEHGPVEQRWLWREARLRDPDGNELCLFHAGDNRRYPPWRVPVR